MLQEQEYVGLLLAKARRRLKQAVLAQATPFGLTAQQFWLLLALQENPGCTLGFLVQRQGIDAPTASRVVASLARRKLVRMQIDSKDRRRSHLALTAAGARLCLRLEPIAAGVRAAVTEGMSAKEEDALRASLRKVMSNLERFDGQAATDEAAPAIRTPAHTARSRR